MAPEKASSETIGVPKDNDVSLPSKGNTACPNVRLAACSWAFSLGTIVLRSCLNDGLKTTSYIDEEVREIVDKVYQGLQTPTTFNSTLLRACDWMSSSYSVIAGVILCIFGYYWCLNCFLANLRWRETYLRLLAACGLMGFLVGGVLARDTVDVFIVFMPLAMEVGITIGLAKSC